MELIDTHCHLQFENYCNREDEVLKRAVLAGVKKFICVGTSLSDSRAAAELANSKKPVWAAAGVHPHVADSFLADADSVKKLRTIASLPKVVAVGEVGLDYYKQYSAKEAQTAALRMQIESGIDLNLPFIFHIRDAWADFWQIFDSYKSAGQPIRGVVHSFSTDPVHLDEILSRGLHVGLNGIMTFTEDTSQLASAKVVPKDRLLLETDAPFLTPAPRRDELCEPKHIATIAKFLSTLRGEKLEELTKYSTANAERLFAI